MPVTVEINRGATDANLANFAASGLRVLRERFKREFDYDPHEVMQHLTDPGFSIRTLRESLDEQVLREAVSESMFGYLVRYGVQKTILDNYALVPTIYEAIAMIAPSKTYEEWYSPIMRTDIPVAVERGEDVPEGRLQGLQYAIRNQRFGRALTIERELIEDDQTGQIVRRAQQMGDGMKYAEELAFLTALFAALSPAAVAAGTTPPANVAGSPGAPVASPLTQTALEVGWSQLTQIVDLEGNFMLVKPDALVVGTQDEITARKLLESVFQPSAPSGVAGSVGYFGTKNVLEGKFDVFSSVFVGRARAPISGLGYPWAIMQKNSMAGVFQPRTPVEVEMELPNTGSSLRRYQYTYVVYRRFGVGSPDPRFAFVGN